MPTVQQAECLRSATATVQRGVVKADGKLLLSPQQLVFQPFNKELGMGPYTIERTSIVTARRCLGNGAGVFPLTLDAMELRLQDGSVYQFIVANPDEWLQQLRA